MKSISFENLRRLVGGGRKKKEKESSFKRSDSFKRISIRKSYLDRGKKKHIAKLEVATQTVAEEEILKLVETVISKKVDSCVQVDDINVDETRKGGKKSNSKSGPGQSVIAYGQWLQGIRKDDVSPSGFKGSERTIIYVPAADEDRSVTPVIEELQASPGLKRKPRMRPASPSLQRTESNDSAVEMFPWGDATEVKKSPLLIRRNFKQSEAPLMPDPGTEELCSLSISLGRIWMDAPLAMAPRSLEMPKTAAPSSSVHHSLDSSLKELRDDPILINRLQKRPTPPVARTLSSTSNTTVSTGLFSSKDSGFSFSTTAPKLSDFNVPVSSGKGFFRKKKPKPKLSVSRDGYFKRTSGALVEAKRSSVRRRSSRKKKSKGKKRFNSSRNDLYQVVVSRPARSLRFLKLDPMIFVPPEKRKVAVSRKQSFKLGMREIRNFNPLDSSMYSTRRSTNESVDEGLYESLPGDYDDLSDEQPLSGRISRISIRDEDDYDLPSNDYNNALYSEESLVSGVASLVMSDEEDDDESTSCGTPYIVPGVSPVPRRRPVRRRKSGLSHKRSITYVVRPKIARVPSTLRRPSKKLGKLLATN